jgi:hypothetical protein
MVLGVDGPAVFARVIWNAVRHGPGGGHPFVLQTQVPVQATGTVLLDDEARRALPLTPFLRCRLGRGLEVALALVLAEPLAIFLARLRRHQNRRRAPRWGLLIGEKPGLVFEHVWL